MLHEYGHIAAKEYFRPTDGQDYLAVKWFEELLATYFAYAFVDAFDPTWAETARIAWLDEVGGYVPSTLSLDWSFMNDLPGNELAQTYGWYQFMLNLRAAEVYEEHGLDFLHALKDKLLWQNSHDWNTAMLLPRLEEVAPGFEAWEDSLPLVYGKEAGNR